MSRRKNVDIGKNRHGLDMSYFRNLFDRELNKPLADFTPKELARVLARASRTADPDVMHEPEFLPGMAIVSAMADDAYQALQNELSVMQAAIESYETPAAALKALIDWHVAVATDPRVNGGMALVPVDVLDDVVNLAGYSVTHTEFNSSLRRSFIKCGDLLAATKEKGE